MIYPLKLSYATAMMLWGGTRLITDWGKHSDSDKLAETWELTVRDDGRMSFIENGKDAGISLRDYITKYGNSVVSDKYDGGRFPLLVKFIDAADRLSVQVHPDDAYAGAVENDSGKTEMWYIVDAEPGAELVYGLAEGVDGKAFSDAVSRGDYNGVMKRIKVRAGESYFIPSGMLHAIGAGILIAEIQQNSDLTYRVYDYDRRGADGKPRQLHVKKAIDVVRPFTSDEINGLRYEKGGLNDAECLADSKYFKVMRINLSGKREFDAKKNSFHCLLCLGGEAAIDYGDEKYTIKRGECWYIPAGAGRYTLNGNALLLTSSV